MSRSTPNVAILVLGAHLLIMVALAVTQNKSPESPKMRKQILHGTTPNVNSKKLGPWKGLTFDPPFVDLGSCAVSVVWRQKVNVQHDGSISSPVTVISISGSSLSFHCSFVSNKIIEPTGNATFEVAFLGREEGFVEDTLFIHTSHGSFPYQVKARGITNPFHLKPLVGVKLPINSTFTPVIQLYNPFATSLQVTEMFGSSCDLHIEMLTPADKGSSPADWWLVPPHKSKPIARLSYIAQRSANLTAFVRIRTNSTGHPHGSLMLPVSVEVTSQPLLYCPQQVLDFGVFRTTADAPKTLKIFLFNSGTKSITLQSFSITPQTEGVVVDFSPVKVAPSMTTPTLAAQVTFNPSLVSSLRTLNGKITLKSKTGHYKVSIGYQVTVPTSYLQVNVSTTQFRVSSGEEQKNACQFVRVRNDFALPVHIYGASLSPQPHALIRNFTEVVLGTRESSPVVQVCLQDSVELTPPLSIPLLFSTNVSDFEVPVTIFTGRLKAIWPEGCYGDEEVDVGWLLEGSSREIYFALHNPNPVGVAFQGWGTNNSNAVLKYLGAEPRVGSRFEGPVDVTNLTMASSLRPNHYAVFLVEVHPPRSGTSSSVFLNIRTVYEEFRIKLKYKLLSGGIYTIPDPLMWSANFLDPYLSTEVYLNSSVKQAITVVGFQTPDVEVQNSTALILASSPQSAGRLSYQLHWDCAESLLAKLVGNWQLGERLWNALLDLDISQALYNCFQNISSALNDISSIRLVTRELGHVELPIATEIQWPRLTVNPVLRFPLTEVGQQSSAHLTLVNPTSNVIGVQLLWPSQSQLPVEDFLLSLPEHLLHDVSFLTNHTGNPFSIADDNEEEALTLVLPPGYESHVKLNFNPTSNSTYSSLLAIKNNITGVELVTLRGTGDRSHFLLGNRLPGSLQPLILDISDKLLKNCERSWQSRFYLPSVTAKGSFTARNQGQFPIHITGYEIEQSECEGYGFRVLQCEPFTLLPNQSRLIEIAFTPDFTQTRTERTLRVHSSIGGASTLTFSLVATVPAHMLILCAAILPRPSWEVVLYYAAVFVSLLLVISVVAAAALKADLLIKSALVAMVTVVPDTKNKATLGEDLHILDFKKAVKETTVADSKETNVDAIQGSCESKNNKGKKNKGKKTKKAAPNPLISEIVAETNRQVKLPEDPLPLRVSSQPNPAPKKEDPPPNKKPQPVAPKKVGKPKSPVTVTDEPRVVKTTKTPVQADETSKTDSNKTSVRPQKPVAKSPVTVQETGVVKPESAPSPKPVFKPLEHSQPPLKQSNRPQPPVGKILPEVRKTEETSVPKPIGPRKPEKVGRTSSFPWTDGDLRSTLSPTIVNTVQSYSSPAGSQSWYPTEAPLGPHYAETSRDSFGLRSLANHVNDPWPSASQRTLLDGWNVHASAIGRQENLIQPLVTPPLNQTYSPWSAPNWLEVSQRNYPQVENRREDPLTEYGPFSATLNSIWQPLHRNGNDPWQPYHQF